MPREKSNIRKELGYFFDIPATWWEGVDKAKVYNGRSRLLCLHRSNFSVSWRYQRSCCFNDEQKHQKHMGVSKNMGTPKSSILIRFSIINHPFWGTPIFGNTHTHLFLEVFFVAGFWKTSVAINFNSQHISMFIKRSFEVSRHTMVERSYGRCRSWKSLVGEMCKEGGGFPHNGGWSSTQVRRGLYTHYKDSLLQVGWPSPIQGLLPMAHLKDVRVCPVFLNCTSCLLDVFVGVHLQVSTGNLPNLKPWCSPIQPAHRKSHDQ